MQKVCCYIEIDGKKVVLKEKRLDECSKIIWTDRSSQYVVYILKAYFKILDGHNTCGFLSSNQWCMYKKTGVSYC